MTILMGLAARTGVYSHLDCEEIDFHCPTAIACDSAPTDNQQLSPHNGAGMKHLTIIYKLFRDGELVLRAYKITSFSFFSSM